MVVLKNDIELMRYLHTYGLKKAYMLEDIYVSKKGNVVCIKLFKNGYRVKEVKTSQGINGMVKFNYTKNGKVTTQLLHKAIYNTFNDIKCEYGDICFIDGDLNNCSYDNLITVNDLLKEYRQLHKIKSIV